MTADFQHLHRVRRAATRLRLGVRRPPFWARAHCDGPIGSMPVAPTNQIANVCPHIQILFMSNSGMRCAGESRRPLVPAEPLWRSASAELVFVVAQSGPGAKVWQQTRRLSEPEREQILTRDGSAIKVE
jgi:hypothetical protein